MESLANITRSHQPLRLSFNPDLPSLSKPLSSVSCKTPSPFKFSSIRASSSSSPFRQTRQDPCPDPSVLQYVKPVLASSFIAFTAAVALFFVRLQHKPAIAAPGTTKTATVETVESNLSLEEQERAIEGNMTRNPNDVEALRSLMEVRIKARKFPEAIAVIDRLIELDPEEFEWPMLKSQIYNFSGDLELAKRGFEEILAKDPLRVEAYHGLVMAYSDAGNELKDLEKRIESALERCKKERRNKDLRDFKLLIAQLRVIEGKNSEALKVYQDLAKEEPRDFRPYLCMGMIYTLLNKKDEAEKSFEKFRRLVPEGHPYREYFVDNMIATKLFAEKTEREKTGKT